MSVKKWAHWHAENLKTNAEICQEFSWEQRSLHRKETALWLLPFLTLSDLKTALSKPVSLPYSEMSVEKAAQWHLTEE